MKYTSLVLCALATSAFALPTETLADPDVEARDLEARAAPASTEFNGVTGSTGYYGNNVMNFGTSASLGTGTGSGMPSTGMASGVNTGMSSGMNTGMSSGMGSGTGMTSLYNNPSVFSSGGGSFATNGGRNSAENTPMVGPGSLAGFADAASTGATFNAPTTGLSSASAASAGGATAAGAGASIGNTAASAGAGVASGIGAATSSGTGSGYPSGLLRKRDYFQVSPPGHFMGPYLIPFLREWTDTGYRGTKRDFDPSEHENMLRRRDEDVAANLQKRNLYYNGLTGFGYLFPVNGNLWNGPIAY